MRRPISRIASAVTVPFLAENGNFVTREEGIKCCLLGQQAKHVACGVTNLRYSRAACQRR